MPGFLEIFFSFLAAIGLTAIVWVLLGTLLGPASVEGPVYAVLRSGEEKEIDRTLHSLKWLRQWGVVDLRIIVVDDGMSPEEKDAVLHVCHGDPAVVLCEDAEVMRYLGDR